MGMICHCADESRKDKGRQESPSEEGAPPEAVLGGLGDIFTESSCLPPTPTEKTYDEKSGILSLLGPLTQPR